MKKHKEEFDIYAGVFDNYTINLLYQIMNKGYFTEFKGIISEGKEANVFLAKNNKKFLAIKIFKTETSSFRRIKEYMLGDPRFPRITKNFRKLVFLWTQKEYKNLMRAYEKGVSVPKPIYNLKNVILMELIHDKNFNPSPPINKCKSLNYKKMYSLVIKEYEKILDSGLVHADFSEYNILNRNNKPVIIDWAQAILIEHPRVLEFMERDLVNINKWFKNKGVIVNDELIDKFKRKIIEK